MSLKYCASICALNHLNIVFIHSSYIYLIVYTPLVSILDYISLKYTMA